MNDKQYKEIVMSESFLKMSSPDLSICREGIEEVKQRLRDIGQTDEEIEKRIKKSAEWVGQILSDTINKPTKTFKRVKRHYYNTKLPQKNCICRLCKQD